MQTEVITGATFSNPAYIIFVQPMVQLGGLFGKSTGMDFHSVTPATCISARIGKA